MTSVRDLFPDPDHARAAAQAARASLAELPSALDPACTQAQHQARHDADRTLLDADRYLRAHALGFPGPTPPPTPTNVWD
jgi:hypothetical protein